MIFRAAVLLALMGSAASGSAAEIVSARAGHMTATLYQSYRGFPDIALISETRAIALEAGDNVIRFDNVASTLIPQTAQISGLPNPPSESDFDYDLFDPATVLRKSVDRPAELIQSPIKAPEQHRLGKLVSDQGILAFQDENGVEALGCGGPPARLIVETPPGLRSTPSLSVHVRAAKPGRWSIRLSYLAKNLRWHASYVLRLAPDERHLTLEARIVLNNDTATSFDNVPTRFVAGEVPRLPGTAAPRINSPKLEQTCWGMGRTSDPIFDTRKRLEFPSFADKSFQRQNSAYSAASSIAPGSLANFSDRAVTLETLGDLKLYRLEEPVRIAALQQKLFDFITADNVKVESISFVPNPAHSSVVDQPAIALWRIRNSESDGLGKPLPRGGVTLYGDDRGYVSTSQVTHDIAEDGQLDLRGSPRGDVIYSHAVIRGTTAYDAHHYQHSLTLKNTTDHNVTVEVESSPTSSAVPVGLAKARTANGDEVWTTTLRPFEEKATNYSTDDPF